MNRDLAMPEKDIQENIRTFKSFMQEIAQKYGFDLDTPEGRVRATGMILHKTYWADVKLSGRTGYFDNMIHLNQFLEIYREAFNVEFEAESPLAEEVLRTIRFQENSDGYVPLSEFAHILMSALKPKREERQRRGIVRRGGSSTLPRLGEGEVD